MAGGNSHEIWTRCIEVNYLASARPAGKKNGEKCPTCNSPKDCNNYYCLLCKVGGLCPITFRTTGPNSDPGEHHRHLWLQVRNYSHKPAVLEADLARFIGLESTKYIQKNSQNQADHCYLRSTKQPEPSSNDASSSKSKASKKNELSASGSGSGTQKCRGCRAAIFSKSQPAVSEDGVFLVCSLQCLMIVADRGPQHRSLLQIRDGAMNLTDHPLFATEKGKQPRPAVAADELPPNNNSDGELPPNNSDGGVQRPPVGGGRAGGRRAASTSANTPANGIPQRRNNAAGNRPGFQVGGFNLLITEIKCLGDWERNRPRSRLHRNRRSTTTTQSQPQI